MKNATLAPKTADMTLIRTCYITSPTSQCINLNVLRDILAVSQKNNLRDGITGALATFDGLYFQVLEGPDELVQNLIQRIEHDDRCGRIIRLSMEAIRERVFANWSMAVFSRTPNDVTLGFESIDVLASSLMNTKDTASVVYSFFQSVSRVNEPVELTAG